MTDYLASLRLILHPDKTQIYQVKDGVPFLGFKVYPEYKVVKKQSIRRYKRFLRKKLKMRAERKLSPDELEAGLNSWLGHIRFGQNLRLENQIYRYLWSRGVNLFRHPSGSWRVLER